MRFSRKEHKGRKEMKMTMKKKMIVVGCVALVALSGCDGEKKSVESIGIIGGEDGPTATWMTT